MVRKVSALIVEDSTTARKMIIGALKQTGLADFEFIEAADGVDALVKFEPSRTQLLFVDMNMPRMGGLELIRELRKRYVNCPPAVMITGEAGTDRLKAALNEPGVAAFLLKPVDRDRLRTGLKTIIDSLPETLGPCLVPHGECVPMALQEVLQRACGLTLTQVAEDEKLRRGQILLGMVSFYGDVHWSVALGFEQSAATGIATRFAGSGKPLETFELGDAIGELVNIVAGRVKLLLSSRGVAVRFSFPTVISANGLCVLTSRYQREVVAHTHFDSPAGKLWTAVTVGLTGDIIL